MTRCFSLTLDALDNVIDFIEDNDIEKPTRIDYINYLIGYFVFHKNVINDSAKEKLIGWIDNTDFTNKTNSERRELFTKLIEG